MHGLIFETSVCYWQNQPGCYLSVFMKTELLTNSFPFDNKCYIATTNLDFFPFRSLVDDESIVRWLTRSRYDRHVNSFYFRSQTCFPAHESLTSHNIVLYMNAKRRAMRFLVHTTSLSIIEVNDEMTEPVVRRTLTDDFMITA